MYDYFNPHRAFVPPVGRSFPFGVYKGLGSPKVRDGRTVVFVFVVVLARRGRIVCGGARAFQKQKKLN